MTLDQLQDRILELQKAASEQINIFHSIQGNIAECQFWAKGIIEKEKALLADESVAKEDTSAVE